jgi:hypothetical protein
LLYSAVIYGVLLIAARGLGLEKSDLVEFQDGEKPLGDDLLGRSRDPALDAGIHRHRGITVDDLEGTQATNPSVARQFQGTRQRVSLEPGLS